MSFGQAVEEEDFDFAAGVGLGADEAGGDDPRVVENEGVAGDQVGEQIVEMAVGDGAVDPVQHQQARVVADGCRVLGDEFFGRL